MTIIIKYENEEDNQNNLFPCRYTHFFYNFINCSFCFEIVFFIIIFNININMNYVFLYIIHLIKCHYYNILKYSILLNL